MKVARHRQFKKHFKSRISKNPKLVKRFHNRLEMFIVNSKDPTLKDYKLIGKKRGFGAFSLIGDIRVVYKRINNKIVLYDIGTHNQVY